MSKINRFDGDVKAFASDATGTNRTVFGEVTQSDELTDQITADFKKGWEIVGASEFPSLQDFSAAQFTATQFISYLHQMGIAEWNAAQEYPTKGALCVYNGELWKRGASWVIGDEPSVSGSWGMVTTSDQPSITGSATFTNATQNINLIGIGAIYDLEIGDVIQVLDSTSNDTEYTVESIADSDNIIVNYEHRGQSTSKALTDETSSSVTIKLLCKWYNAPIGLGQGWCAPASGRSNSVTYTNSTKRSVTISVNGSEATSALFTLVVDGVTIVYLDFGAGVLGTPSLSSTICNDSDYSIVGTSYSSWYELR